MAEGFFKKYAPRGYSTISAGTRPAGEINAVAIQAILMGMDDEHSFPLPFTIST